jgi:hypothetical protein
MSVLLGKLMPDIEEAFVLAQSEYAKSHPNGRLTRAVAQNYTRESRKGKPRLIWGDGYKSGKAWYMEFEVLREYTPADQPQLIMTGGRLFLKQTDPGKEESAVVPIGFPLTQDQKEFLQEQLQELFNLILQSEEALITGRE